MVLFIGIFRSVCFIHIGAGLTAYLDLLRLLDPDLPLSELLLLSLLEDLLSLESDLSRDLLSLERERDLSLLLPRSLLSLRDLRRS